jgi:uncharacterized protein (PEP-CTERM system associated)
VETVYDIGQNSLLPTWSAGLTHTIGRTSLSLESQGDYVNNPGTIYNSFRSVYSATVTQEFNRTRLSANASYSDYSGQGTSHTKDFSTGLQLSYDITPRLGISLSGTRVNSSSSQDNLNRYYGSAELTYALPKDFSLKLYVRHKLSDSATSSTERYQANIVGLGLRKSF